MLDGRLALVTGGSRGLGRAIALKFAEDGADVVITWSRRGADGEATLEALRATGRRAWGFQVDVRDREGIRAMVKTIEAEAGRPIDVLVNNAGHGQVVPLVLMEPEDWDRMIDVHVKGAFIVTQAVLRGMIKLGRGRVLNVGSLAGVKMMQAPVHYATVKAALKGFTEALAKEIGRYGITVNCLAPGVLEEGVSSNLPENRREEYLRHCSLGRLGTVEEVARVASFLASDANSFMNGATIVVDGAV